MATQEQVKKFIETIAPIVQKKCKEHGWGVPSAIIGQAGLESAWGTSGLATSCFNFFGMKWKDGCGTGYKEYSTKEQRPDGSYYTVIARFRKYADLSDGIDGYFKFIESYSRYKPVIATEPGDYRKYAINLKTCGWATSLKYAQNIILTVDKYKLYQYDKGFSPEQMGVDVRNFPTVRKGDRGEYVAVLQQSLNWWNIRGGFLGVDGIFGTQTSLSVIEFQGLRGLVKDGIVGQKTWAALMNK